MSEAIIATSNWSSIQKRCVDSFAKFSSDTINSLTNICGKTRGKITGMEFELIFDEETDILFAHYTEGSVLKDSVIIMFNDDMYIPLGKFPNMANGEYYLCLDYLKEPKYPQNIASIIVTTQPYLDPNRYLILHKVTKTGSNTSIMEITQFIYSAENTLFNNESTNLLSTNVQHALEELYQMFMDIQAEGLSSNRKVLYEQIVDLESTDIGSIVYYNPFMFIWKPIDTDFYSIEYYTCCEVGMIISMTGSKATVLLEGIIDDARFNGTGFWFVDTNGTVTQYCNNQNESIAFQGNTMKRFGLETNEIKFIPIGICHSVGKIMFGFGNKYKFYI